MQKIRDGAQYHLDILARSRKVAAYQQIDERRGINPEFTAYVAKRWQEYEAGNPTSWSVRSWSDGMIKRAYAGKPYPTDTFGVWNRMFQAASRYNNAQYNNAQ